MTAATRGTPRMMCSPFTRNGGEVVEDASFVSDTLPAGWRWVVIREGWVLPEGVRSRLPDAGVHRGW